MKLIDRLRQSVVRRHANVFLRADFSGLGSATQLSEALRSLQSEGILNRLGPGVYAKTFGPSAEERISLIKETYRKFGYCVISVSSTLNKFDVYLVGARRHPTKIVIDGKEVHVRLATVDAPILPNNVEWLPTLEVAEYIENLAKVYHIRFRHGPMEEWSEAVTRVAGGNATTDKARGLLVRLKQRKVLNDRQFARLITNLGREQRHV